MKYSVIIYVFIFAFFTSCKNEIPEQKQDFVMNVRTEVVKKEKISIPVRAAGVLTSEKQFNLSFLAGGIIREIYVDEGEEVKKDELLAKLDPTEISSRSQQAESGLEKAQRDFNRVENLYRDTVASLEQYQNAKTALDIAQSNYEIATFNRKYSEIHAPSNGRILKRMAEENEITSAGRLVFVFASSEADWVLNVNLSDRNFVMVSLGDSAVVSFDAYPGRNFPAYVSELAALANLSTGTWKTELKLHETPERMLAGLSGKAEIFPPSEEMIIIPASSLMEAEGLTAFVYKKMNGKAVKTKIEIEALADNGIIVKEGILAGDTIITAGNAYIKDGELIEEGGI